MALGVVDAARYSAQRVITKKISIVLYPGGGKQPLNFPLFILGRYSCILDLNRNSPWTFFFWFSFKLATEALYSCPKQDILALKSRHGFIKLALEYGIPLVPSFSFVSDTLPNYFSRKDKFTHLVLKFIHF
eukprot:Sdes_comp19241_c0_seq2m10182